MIPLKQRVQAHLEGHPDIPYTARQLAGVIPWEDENSQVPEPRFVTMVEQALYAFEREGLVKRESYALKQGRRDKPLVEPLWCAAPHKPRSPKIS